MAAPGNSEYELLTEHFGYPPVALLDEIINTVNVLADRALDSVERLLLSIPPQNLGFSSKHAARDGSDAEAPPLPPAEAAKREIENGTHQLETLLNAAIDKNFDLFELYTMKNILTVRPDDQPYVKLSHYDGLDFGDGSNGSSSSSSSNTASNQAGPNRPTPESVTALRRRLQASQRLHVALETERTRNEALLAKLRVAVGAPPNAATVKTEDAPAPTGPSAFGFLRDRAGLEDAGADSPVATTAEFALSQLQALRALSTSLRTLMGDLGPADQDQAGDRAADDDDDDDGAVRKSWRRERVEYVEGASRKYLENARGLELGAQGEVRDGEWQRPGRKLARGDVEGLEQVVTLLARGKPGQQQHGGRRPSQQVKARVSNARAQQQQQQEEDEDDDEATEDADEDMDES